MKKQSKTPNFTVQRRVSRVQRHRPTVRVVSTGRASPADISSLILYGQG